VAANVVVGSVGELLVFEQIQAVHLPVTGLKGGVRLAVVFLHHGVGIHRTGIALLEPVGVADLEQ
jgi:hypothetical protein